MINKEKNRSSKKLKIHIGINSLIRFFWGATNILLIGGGITYIPFKVISYFYNNDNIEAIQKFGSVLFSCSDEFLFITVFCYLTKKLDKKNK